MPDMSDADRGDDPATEPRVIDAGGSPYQVGLQFGQATAAQRDAIADVTDRMRHRVCAPPAAQRQALEQAEKGLQRHSPATLEQIRGMSEALSIPAEHLLHGVLCTYLDDVAGVPPGNAPDGCSTWAASGDMTAAGGPMLVKNRDYRPDHLALQALLRVVPDGGIPWCALTSAGAPGVYGAGMNAAGVAVADTYVPAADVGPGVPRFSLMMHVLEQATTVADAIAYLRSVPIMGAGNLILADAGGALAVVECGYRSSGFTVRRTGTLVATNHYVTDSMAGSQRLAPDSDEARDSRTRADLLTARLASAVGRIDEDFARTLMAHHGGPLASLCRHRIPGSDARTIASLLCWPRARQVTTCFGFPCRASFRTVDVARDLTSYGSPATPRGDAVTDPFANRPEEQR